MIFIFVWKRANNKTLIITNDTDNELNRIWNGNFQQEIFLNSVLYLIYKFFTYIEATFRGEILVLFQDTRLLKNFRMQKQLMLRVS